MVTHPASEAKDYPLRPWDVITRIGDSPLDNKGQIALKEDLRVNFEYLIPKIVKDGRVKVQVFRDRKTLDVEVPVRVDPDLVLPSLDGKYPRYFVHGPMVFSAASLEMAARSGGLALSQRTPLFSRMMDERKFEGEELVTLGAGLLPHRLTRGYSSQAFAIISKVNGTPVRNLTHLVELVRDAQGEFITFDLAGRYETLVFRRDELSKATEEVLADEGIRKQYSDDLESVWKKK